MGAARGRSWGTTVGRAVLAVAVASTLALAVPELAGAQARTSLYRLLQPVTGDHLYTTSAAERDAAVRSGFRDEHIAAFVRSGRAPDTVPLYRLFNGIDHFYTTSRAERDLARTFGYRPEGIAAWVYSRDFTGGVTPLFRLFNGTDHFYTIFGTERDAAVAGGYRSEGQVGFVDQGVRQGCPGPFVEAVIWSVRRRAGRSDHWKVSIVPDAGAARPGVSDVEALWQAVGRCVPAHIRAFPYWTPGDARSAREQLYCHDLGPTSGTWDLETERRPADVSLATMVSSRCNW